MFLVVGGVVSNRGIKSCAINDLRVSVAPLAYPSSSLYTLVARRLVYTLVARRLVAPRSSW